jgi:hypothetical protein
MLTGKKSGQETVEDIEFIILSKEANNQGEWELPSDHLWMSTAAQLIEDGFLKGHTLMSQDGATYADLRIIGITAFGREKYKTMVNERRSRSLWAKTPFKAVGAYVLGCFTPTIIEWIKHLFGPHVGK